MNAHAQGEGIEVYFQSVLAIERETITRQRPVLVEVARAMAVCISQGRRIFVFGTGHSHMLAEEAFYRAGGLAAAVPIISSALMVHEHPEFSGRLERTPGLAENLLEAYAPQPGEIIFIVSNSGVNTMPVEMALAARKRGLLVVSISSFEYSRIAPLSPLGKRLDEIADFALDNCCPPGDALVPIPATTWRAGPGSTILTALIWNCLVVETAYLMQAAGEIAPVIVSLNLPGASEHNKLLLDAWKAGNPHL